MTIRQTRGADNSLGFVKLVFPNDNDAYLHDTPATQLFARSCRDFSHGCIRVERPAELAAWALRNNPGWRLHRVQEAMQHGDDDMTVYLAKRIPDLIVCGTAIVHENNEVHFKEDIYRFSLVSPQHLQKDIPTRNKSAFTDAVHQDASCCYGQCLESIGTTAGHRLPRAELNEPNACAV